MQRATRNYFNFKTDSHKRFFITPKNLSAMKDELDDFLDREQHLNDLAFAKRVLFSQEIKANNSIEGYNDDIELIKKITETAMNISDAKRRRILNLYHGYRYILKNYPINKDTLKELYDLLSEGILTPEEIETMGEYYRKDKVYIVGPRLDIPPIEGMPASELESFMDCYLEFLNKNESFESVTDHYIKSQILHLYLVYIHPYYDANGRTSRTTAMWYLLNNRAFPYIIFNRGINFHRKEYDRIIEDARAFNDFTFFVNYMMKTVKLELEKESVMQSIASATFEKLSATDYQTILYYLTMHNQIKTVCDFATFFNYHNDRKRVQEIYETMLLPLIDKGILEVTRTTHTNMFGNTPNEVLKLNKSKIDDDPQKIKRLILE